MDGINNGFRIIQKGVHLVPVRCENYKSATDASVKMAVEEQIMYEIERGNYVACEAQPAIVSSLGAIPKGNGKIRLIHDCSRPIGKSVNSYTTTTSITYETIDKALSLLPERGYMAKVDLRNAYRVVPIHPDCYDATGLSWTFEGSNVIRYFVDTRLPFGAAMSPEIFNRLSGAVARMMRRRGFVVVYYMDDFLIIGKNKVDCKLGYDTIQRLVSSLGFEINYDKLVEPCQKLTFLGIEIDSKLRTLSLPANKLSELKLLLGEWSKKKKATKRELQVLVGKLNWASRVIYGGRTFLRRLIELMNTLRRSSHHTRITKCARLDILWWNNFCQAFNGTCSFVDSRPVPGQDFSTDACLEGGAAYYKGDWFYCNWKTDFPKIADMHINFKELYVVYLAAMKWHAQWRNKYIVVYTDNITAKACINKGSCRNETAMVWLRDLFWLSAVYNFRLSARYIPGKDNFAADAISRINCVKYLFRAMPYIRSCMLKCSVCECSCPMISCDQHISDKTFKSLQVMWENSGTSSQKNCLNSGKQHMQNLPNKPTRLCAQPTYDFASTSDYSQYLQTNLPYHCMRCFWPAHSSQTVFRAT